MQTGLWEAPLAGHTASPGSLLPWQRPQLYSCFCICLLRSECRGRQCLSAEISVMLSFLSPGGTGCK